MPVQFVNGGYIVWQDNDTLQWLMLCERSLSTDLYSLQKIICFLFMCGVDFALSLPL